MTLSFAQVESQFRTRLLGPGSGEVAQREAGAGGRGHGRGCRHGHGASLAPFFPVAFVIISEEKKLVVLTSRICFLSVPLRH